MSRLRTSFLAVPLYGLSSVMIVFTFNVVGVDDRRGCDLPVEGGVNGVNRLIALKTLLKSSRKMRREI